MPERYPGEEPNHELDMQKEFTVTRISQGFEFGHGTISGEGQPDVLRVVDETIEQSPELLVPIDTDEEGNIIDDDGCGDGRGVKTVFSGLETSRRIFKRSLNRAKVFGGAVTMALAARIGRGEADRKSLNGAFDEAVDTLIDEDIDFGAHTDEHAHGEKCGCGAIDNAPAILMAALKYEFPIRGVVAYLGLDDSDMNEVYRNYRDYVSNALPLQPKYEGNRVMDRILNEAKVVKQLGGGHKERRIVLNMVRGKTVNQKLIRDRTDGEAQIFAVDVWRMEDIAKDLYKHDKRAQQQALLSELVYTLATAGVLTKGDLPVYVVQEQPAYAAV